MSSLPEPPNAPSAVRRPRVLIVAPSLHILGGQAVQATALLESLRREDSIEIDFLPVNPRLRGLLGRLQGTKYIRTVVTSGAYVASLLARVPRYDVLHIFSASYWSFILAPTPALVIGRLCGKKTILNYRSGEAEDHLEHWRSAHRFIRIADRIITPSGYLVDVFGRFGFQAAPIYNIVDTARFRFRLRKPLRPVFLSNRNLEGLYNVACVLRAFAIVQQRYPEARLLIVGDGSERTALEMLAQTLRLRNVDFLGRVPHDRMHELYNTADIYLNSPNIDNMPVSIIESYAAGLPIVTTDAGGIPYIVRHGETGLLVPQNDHGAMAAAAIEYLETPGLAERISVQAHAECLKYTWSAVREQWLALYRQLSERS